MENKDTFEKACECVFFYCVAVVPAVLSAALAVSILMGGK